MTPVPASGRLASNVLQFGRLLRRAGLPVGPDRTIDAVQAVEAVGIHNQTDFYWALHSVLVRRHEHSEIFDQAFRLFWRDPMGMGPTLDALLPKAEVGAQERELPARRLREARKAPSTVRAYEEVGDYVELDVVMEYSPDEVIRTRDFEEMSTAEVEQAKRMIRTLRLRWPERPTRRYSPDESGNRVDLRATMRATLRTGGGIIPLKRRSPVPKPPVVVALCDISGSMERYSRLLLHFLHTLTNDRHRVHSFVFSTHLTNVTRHLKDRDVDRALDRVGKAATDWSGGTRIGSCLRAFNSRWSRRVLSQGGVVLLITDGLDLDRGHGLSREAERLAKSCQRLVWLNPLLRYEQFEARAAGVKAILPHVDQHRPAHNVASLEGLAEALSG